MSITQKPYRISAGSSTSAPHPHPLDINAVRTTTPLSDLTGLTQLGVHLCRVAPQTMSTALHWHNSDDEWMYILDAGQGATLLVLPENASTPKEEPLNIGDFVGFPAGRRDAHAFRAGEKELVYLCGGTRKELDVCFYPEKRMRLVTDRTQTGSKSFFLDDQNTITREQLRAAQREQASEHRE